MTNTIITGQYFGGITLTATYTTIASTGSVTSPGTTIAAIYGPTGSAWTVANYGSVAGLASGDGITLGGGGLVNNAATITGAVGVLIGGASGTVVNANYIDGSSYGIGPLAGGSISNAATGTILGDISAIDIRNAGGTVVNSGRIAANSAGIYSTDGGFVINAAHATIVGGSAGVLIKGAAGTVANSGSIGGGIKLDAGGYLSNSTSGTVTGEEAVFIAVGAGTVVNAGTLAGSSHGIYAIDDGFITNTGSGTISGGSFGVNIENAGAVLNGGSISGDLAGVSLGSGSVTNTATGSIVGALSGVSIDNPAATVVNSGAIAGTGGNGVYLFGGTVVNAGTISGAAGSAAVDFGGPDGRNLLIVDPGAVFNGSVTAAGASNTIELASAASVGSLTGIGSSFTGFNTIDVLAGAQWSLSGTIGGSGTVAIGAGSVITFDDGVSAGQAVDFDTASGTLGVGDAAAFAATVFGFQAGDAIDFASVTSTGSITAGVDGSNDLTLTSGGSLLASIQLDPGQNFAGDIFYTASDGSGGTIVEAPLCFLAGTRIGTPSGEVRVEHLKVDDPVLTARGEVRRIVWIGKGRTLATRGQRTAATPVIVRKGALDDNVPYDDLRVTKAHALHLDGVLVPVEFLINHRSIVWDDRAQEVALYHIELETHDVVLANGAPAETYRDDGNRWLFQNGNTGWTSPPSPPCFPVVTGGPVVDATWLRLLRRSGPRPGVPLTDDPDLHVVVGSRRLNAIARTGDLHLFTLPGRPDRVRIASRAATPQELGIARDPRCLGVAIRRIMVAADNAVRTIEADNEWLTDGFHAFEPDNGYRWTDGNAVLPTDLFAGLTGSITVMLHCAGAMHYVEDGLIRLVA